MNNNIKTLINIAQKEVGYLEKASNNDLDCKVFNAGDRNFTKYARDCFPDLQGYPWCCMFVWWVFEKAFGKNILKDLIGEKTAKCSTMKKNMFEMGNIYDKPAIGDIVFYVKDGEINHNGIVVGIETNNIITIEGNTATGQNVIIPNGGGVYQKVYSKYNIRIDSYGRPNWTIFGDVEEKEETNIKAVICATNVNIRKGAGINYRIIGNETLGFEFNVVDEQYDSCGFKWIKFNYHCQMGFIRSDFVKIRNE